MIIGLSACWLWSTDEYINLLFGLKVYLQHPLQRSM